LASSIAIQTTDRGPLTIPLVQVRLVSRSKDGTALVELVGGEILATRDRYDLLSDRMCSTHVGGIISTEQVL